MLHWFFFWLAMIAGGGAGEGPRAEAKAPVSEPAFEAEDQTPTGQFTTAAEVKPILNMTQANWVAVREYDGLDLLYVTHLLSWRCGMHRFSLSINDGPFILWNMPPCLTETAQPNAIRTEDGLPYTEFPLGHIETVEIEILYDDMTTERARFERKAVLLP